MATRPKANEICAYCGALEHSDVSIGWLEKQYGVSGDTWRRAIAKNEIRAIKVGRQLRVDLRSVHDWIRVVSDGTGL